MPPSAVTDSDDAAVATNRRRVSNARDRDDLAMEPPRLIRGGPCLLILTETQRSCDECVTQGQRELARVGLATLNKSQTLRAHRLHCARSYLHIRPSSSKPDTNDSRTSPTR